VTSPMGELPVHLAVQWGESLDAMELLIRQCPEALLVSNRDGELPLHLVYEGRDESRDRSLDVVRLVVRHGPEALRQTTKDGNLPLHTALQWHAPDDDIRFLVEQGPRRFKQRRRSTS
jgi:ankyrin repeat protein